MEHRLKNERELMELVQQLTQTQQQQVLQRLKDLSERKRVFECTKSLLRDPHQIIP